MPEFSRKGQALPRPPNSPATQAAAGQAVMRLTSRELMQQQREVEIDHEGRIYRLRITQLNKLILTA